MVLHTRFDVEAVLKEIAAKQDHQLPRRADDVHGARSTIPRSARYDLRSLKFCGSGGAPLPVEVAQRFVARDRLQPERRLGHDRDVADRHLHAGRTASARPARAACRCRGIEIRMLDLDDPTS